MCDNLQVTEKKQCWTGVVERLIRKNDIPAALDALAAFYAKDPAMSETCHGLTHAIGQKAYELFAAHKTFDVNANMSYCSYGFFHGFMEALVKDKFDIQKAQNFCDFIGKELATESPDAKYACFHGIGHGWTNVHDQRFYGNERAMVQPALALCEKVAIDKESLLRCTTGVFDSISVSYYNQLYGLKLNKDDPLWLCKEQEEKYKEACYRDMMPAILWLGKYDLATSLPYVEHLKDAQYTGPAVETLASDSIRYVIAAPNGVEKNLEVCKGKPSQIRRSCVEGIINGMMEFGIPEKAHVAALAFCMRNDLLPTEKELCYRSTLTYVRNRYSAQQADVICMSVDKQYTKYCMVK